MGEFGEYTTEEIDEWQKNPSIRSILTSSIMGAWLMRRDANIELQLGEAIRIPQNATNGDVIKALFPNKGKYDTNGDTVTVWGENQCVSFSLEWWEAPYGKA